MKKAFSILLIVLVIAMALAGCGNINNTQNEETLANGTQNNASVNPVVLTEKVTNLDNGLSAVRYDGDSGFDLFLKQDGASSDFEVISFLIENVLDSADGLKFDGNPFGCSTLSVKNKDGGFLFGRNFDWNSCNALIIQNQPKNGYASISTVNTDFIRIGSMGFSSLPDQIQALVGLYAPLDGLNEKGLAVSVNMIEDSDTIEQNTGKPDITTTTAVRLLLDKAATVDEAVELLNDYDMHASFGYMVHFAIADFDGNSVVAEYVNNELVVIETPAVTNFYLAKGEKNGIGTQQSHERYDTLMNLLSNTKAMEMNDVRDALDSVSKHNFGEFESTEWSIVMNQSTGEVRYYHRENFTKPYVFALTGGRK